MTFSLAIVCCTALVCATRIALCLLGRKSAPPQWPRVVPPVQAGRREPDP